MLFSFCFLLTILLCSAMDIPYSNENLYKHDNYVSGFTRVDPNDNMPIPFDTKAWLWYDEDYLHVYVEAGIDSLLKPGVAVPKDGSMNADYVRLQIVTNPNAYYSYYFLAYPCHTYGDGIRNSSLGTDDQWNSNYDYDTSIKDSLWTIHFKIPFSDMRICGSAPYQWKLILSRRMETSEDSYAFPYVQTTQGLDYYRKAYNITISTPVIGSRSYRIMPYTVFKYNDKESDASYDIESNGVDFAMNLGNNSRLKISCNPDFSDIPLDQAENTYNQKNPYIPDENRFFFQEDIDAFGVGSDKFNTRFISQPIYAVKLTGATSHYRFGFLSTQDRELKEDGYIINNDDFFNVASWCPFDKNWSVQTTLISRRNENIGSEALYLHPQWEFAHNNNIRLYWTGTRYWDSSNEDPKYGAYTDINYQGKTQDLTWTIDATDYSKDYQNANGTIYDVDYSSYSLNLDYNHEGSRLNLINSYGGGTNTWLSKDHFGKKLTSCGFNNWYFVNCNRYDIYPGCSYSVSQSSYNSNLYFTHSFQYNISWNRYNLLGIRYEWERNKDIIYALEEADYRNRNTFGLYGYYGKCDYDIRATNYRYDYNKILDEEGNILMDNDYWVGNISFNIKPTIRLIIKNGLNFSTYEREIKSRVGFYCNVQYDVNQYASVYLGYKTIKHDYEDTLDKNFKLDDLVTNTSSCYMKVSCKI